MLKFIKQTIRRKRIANMPINKYSALIKAQNELAPYWIKIKARSPNLDDVGRRLVEIYDGGGYIHSKAWPLMFFQVYNELRYTKNQNLSFRHQIEILEKQKIILLEKAGSYERAQVQCLEMQRKA